MAGNPERIIGIVADGATDREIVGHLSTTLLTGKNIGRQSTQVVHLRQTIRDSIDRFWKSDQGEKPRDDLAKDIVNVLSGALDDLKNGADRPLSAQDIIVLCSDSERHLSRKEDYFKTWALAVENTICKGIKKFLNRLCSHGHDVGETPLIVPFIPFPSVDILIAVARTVSGDFSQVRGQQARALKKALYETDNLSSLNPDQLQKKALRHISQDALNKIYRELPEARTLFDVFYFGRT